MRRIAIRAALVGVGVLAVRKLAPKLHKRCLAACERMFEQSPEDFPPKRMMRGIEEIRGNTVRTLELLEEREEEGSGPQRNAFSTKTVAASANTQARS